MTWTLRDQRRVIEETGKNLERIEKEKRYTFNIEKTNTMKIGRRKEKEEAKVEQKREKVKEVKEYKFLGKWITSKGKGKLRI